MAYRHGINGLKSTFPAPNTKLQPKYGKHIPWRCDPHLACVCVLQTNFSQAMDATKTIKNILFPMVKVFDLLQEIIEKKG